MRDFLAEVLTSKLRDEEVEELWLQPPTEIGFSEPQGTRRMLELVRDALDAQIARDLNPKFHLGRLTTKAST